MELSSSISVNCVILGYDSEELNVLLVKREPEQSSELEFHTDWSLTGNHVYTHEPIEDAANRVLYDLTGFTDIYLEQFGAFADPDRLSNPNDQEWLKLINRDPSKRVVSIGFFALLSTQMVNLQWMGREVKWTPVKEVDQLAFDHNDILNEALLAVRKKMHYEPIGFELLPAKFTLSQLQHLYEQIFDTEFDKRNFRKKVTRMKYVIPLEEKQAGVPHKPARLYTFSREVFEKTKQELFDFIV